MLYEPSSEKINRDDLPATRSAPLEHGNDTQVGSPPPETADGQSFAFGAQRLAGPQQLSTLEAENKRLLSQIRTMEAEIKRLTKVQRVKESSKIISNPSPSQNSPKDNHGIHQTMLEGVGDSLWTAKHGGSRSGLRRRSRDNYDFLSEAMEDDRSHHSLPKTLHHRHPLRPNPEIRDPPRESFDPRSITIEFAPVRPRHKSKDSNRGSPLPGEEDLERHLLGDEGPCNVAASGPYTRNGGKEDSEIPFKEVVKDRAGWLVGLLVLQSCSSFILERNEVILHKHMVLVQFLTMLVGAGGNAGNQASVRVIRGLAVGSLNERTIKPFLITEAKMAFCLSGILGVAGCIRAAVFQVPPAETVAITTSLCAIVFISVLLGSILPLIMKRVGIDPAHSSTTIQVIMDVLGVSITVSVSAVVLSSGLFFS